MQLNWDRILYKAVLVWTCLILGCRSYPESTSSERDVGVLYLRSSDGQLVVDAIDGQLVLGDSVEVRKGTHEITVRYGRYGSGQWGHGQVQIEPLHRYRLRYRADGPTLGFWFEDVSRSLPWTDH